MTHDHDDHADDHEHHHHHHLEYPDAIQAFRADKDEFFRTSAGSPLPAAEREAFGGLPYFPVDEALRIEGLTLEPYTGNEPTSFTIPTSDGKLKPAERAGTFRFDVRGVPGSLTAYT